MHLDRQTQADRPASFTRCCSHPLYSSSLRSPPLAVQIAAKVLTKKFLSGLIGGMMGVCFATPFDVVKSRMQNQTPGQPRVYTNVPASLYRVLTTEGVTALYKGFGPRLVRLGPGGGIMIVAFDFFANLFQSL